MPTVGWLSLRRGPDGTSVRPNTECVDGGDAALYGLGAMGKPGVTRALELIHAELDVSMALTGTSDVRSVDRRVLWMPDARP